MMLDLLIQFVADDQSKWDRTIQGANMVTWLVLSNFLHIPGVGN